MNCRRKKIKTFLRGGITGLTVSLVFLLFVSWHYFSVNPGDVAKYFAATLGAASGTSVEVPSNPYNTLAQQLIEKEEELEMREKGLEGALIEAEKENRFMLNLILGAVTSLFILLLVNFYFDYQARRLEE